MFQRRLLSIPSCLAVPVYISPEDMEVGRAVFHNFVHDEFLQVGMSDEAVIDNGIIDEQIAMAHGQILENARAGLPDGYRILIRNVGRDISGLAREFAQSTQREQIRAHADEIDLGRIDFDGFWGLLEEVFRHGINVYNIVALFYFCSDVLIKAVKLKMVELGMNLFKWSLKYISEQVCRWVIEHGGWERAIRHIVTKKYFVYGTAAVIIFAFGWGLYKGLKS